MAYDEGLAQRIRDGFVDRDDVVEKKMFGGLCFMVRGHMCCGVVGEELMLRVGKETYPDLLALPHAREMDFTKRPMKGFLFVDTGGVAEDDALTKWIGFALADNAGKPAK